MSERRPVVFHRRFTKPRVTIYRAADRGVRLAWNRYDTATIGCAVVLPTLGRRPGAWCVGITWAKPVSETLPAERRPR